MRSECTADDGADDGGEAEQCAEQALELGALMQGNDLDSADDLVET
jgi:hypothetical protein